MPHLARFILINAPVEAVFAFLDDYRNIPRWQPKFQSARLLTSKSSGVGTVVELRGSFRGLPMTTQNTIVTFEPPHLLVSDSSGSVRGRSTWRLTSVPPASPGDPPVTRA